MSDPGMIRSGANALDFYNLAIEQESPVGIKLDFADTEGSQHTIHRFAIHLDRRAQGVEHRMLTGPQLGIRELQALLRSRLALRKLLPLRCALHDMAFGIHYLMNHFGSQSGFPSVVYACGHIHDRRRGDAILRVRNCRSHKDAIRRHMHGRHDHHSHTAIDSGSIKTTFR